LKSVGFTQDAPLTLNVIGWWGSDYEDPIFLITNMENAYEACRYYRRRFSAYGIKIQTRKGESFQIPIQPIIDTVTYERYLRVRESKKTHLIRSIKYDYLIGGKLFCDCNYK
jgi:hypothetical protein